MDCSAFRANSYIRKQLKRSGYLYNNFDMTKYSRVYLGTNENLKDAFAKVDFSNKNKALCVMASGDQTFNLLAKGITEIDTFDVNALTEYYVLGLRKAMILKYNYEEFIKTSEKILSEETSLEEITTIIYNLTEYMEPKYKKHWLEVLKYNYNAQKNSDKHLNLIHMLSLHYAVSFDLPNYYLCSEELYNQTKENLKNAKITFTRCNVLKLTKHFAGPYDIIYLSNILDYVCHYEFAGWQYNYLEEFLSNLHTLTSPNGIILNYVLDIQPKNRVWQGSCVKREDLINEEIYDIDGVFNQIQTKDLLILSRKKEEETNENK